jgi:hypothetical protein
VSARDGSGAPRPSPRLLRADDVQLGPDDRVVLPGIAGHVIVAVTCFALTGWMAWSHRGGGMGWGWAAAIGFAVLLGCGSAAGMVEVLWKGEWLLAIGPEAVLVRFQRRWDPERPADEPQVVELPMEHVEAVQPVRMTHSWPGRGDSGTQHRTITYLDFRIPGMGLGPLAEVLERERRRRPHDASPYPRPDPVLLVGGNVLRVEMGDTRPGSDEVRRLLGAWLPMEEDVEELVSGGGPPVRKPLRAVR